MLHDCNYLRRCGVGTAFDTAFHLARPHCLLLAQGRLRDGCLGHQEPHENSKERYT